jgi:uncharacterized protein YyaL (SSP411 family)
MRNANRPSIAALIVLGTAACGLGLPAAATGDPMPPPRTATAPTGSLPGAAPAPPALLEQLQSKWVRQPADYRPRTRHLNPDGSPRYTNRLFLSASPYLLQHAHNPVNWYPWGDEAFDTARRLGRPVLLSVGYSTCHWCHVMEEESFEDEEIARYLNEHYVAIKVDREERPDVDAVYMSAVQSLTGGGGWPMTVWLAPDRHPFYGGTYFPARDGDRGSRVGFLTLLRKLHAVYQEQPERVSEAGASLATAIRADLSGPEGTADQPGASALHAAAAAYQRGFDAANGGMRRAPKFPSNLPIRFLLRYHRRTGDPGALQMATLTLEKMAAGGMYDHIGGGFHRYSTDAQWLVPHFEKMLYDNALLAVAYLEAYQVTGQADFARVAEEILRYVQRDMTAPGGGFYSARDADSLTPSGHRAEGYFFTWTPAEMAAALGDEQARAAMAYFAVAPGGTFEGRSILHTPRPAAAVAAELGVPVERLHAAIDEAVPRLRAARARRAPPLRDEKILAAWNGLTISAFAQAALVLGDQDFARSAERAADFVLGQMIVHGRLQRSYRDGVAQHNGYLDDYAFLIAGLLDLYEATGAPRWLERAIALDAVLTTHFSDEAAGGFFMTSDDHETLLAREKPAADGAEPSGNSVQALNLLRLHEVTTDDRYRQRAAATLRAFASVLARSPTDLSAMLLAVDYQLDAVKEIIIVTPTSRGEAEPLLAEIRRTFVPNRTLAVVSEDTLAAQAALVPLLAGKTVRGGVPTAYVCKRRVCALPTSHAEIFARQLREVERLDDGTAVATAGVTRPTAHP